MNDRSRFWDASIILGGALVAGLTLKSYRSFDATAGNPAQNKMSGAEADRTVDSAKSYLNSNPEDFNAWSKLAIAYYYKGPDSYADGINALEKARSLGANSESLFYYAGVMYEALGLPDYAVNELSKYLRHHPEDYETQVRLANLLAQEKKFDDAYKLYQKLSARYSGDPTLWFNFGVVSKEKNDLDGALSCFSKAAALAHGMPEGGFFQEGEIARLKGSDDQAISLYQQELAAHPQSLPTLTALEAAQRRKKLWNDARDTRKRISELKAK